MKNTNKKIVKKLKRMPYTSKLRKIYVGIFKNSLYLLSDKELKDEARKIALKYRQYKKNPKSVKKYVKEMLYYKVMYKSTLQEYFLLHFDEQTERESSKYLTGPVKGKYLRYLNADITKITSNKYKTYLEYKKYFKREVEFIKSEEDFDKFKEYVTKHPEFVKKPHNAAFGRGVELIKADKKHLKEQFDELLQENKKFVMEELIVQDKKMASLHPGSVNTLRICPFIDKDGKVIVYRPFMKVGQKNSFVDNGGAGGILATIDPKTGIVNSNGMDELTIEYEKHPDTNVKFKGFKIPKWNELLKLAEEMAKVHPEARFMGFDMALSEKGWVCVEANGRTQFIGQQMPCRIGLKKEFEELIDWKNVPNKEIYSKRKKSK